MMVTKYCVFFRPTPAPLPRTPRHEMGLESPKLEPGMMVIDAAGHKIQDGVLTLTRPCRGADLLAETIAVFNANSWIYCVRSTEDQDDE